MKRCAMIPVLVVLLCGVAQAQITLINADRQTHCRIQPPDALATVWGDGNYVAGPYLQDFDVVQGDYHLRSLHDTLIDLSGDNLMVSGSFLAALSSDDPAFDAWLTASASLIVGFSVAVPSLVSLEATVGAGAEVWFFDLTDNDYSFDNQGPGTFVLDDTLLPGHHYLLQIFHSASLYPQSAALANQAVTMSLVVGPDPVAVQGVAWGAIKSLYR